MEASKYWLEGKFEEMYQDIPDPWGCLAGRDSHANKIFMETIYEDTKRYSAVLDIGCGLGGFTDNLFAKNRTGFFVGIDVSPTAIRRAMDSFPYIYFAIKDVTREGLTDLGRFDLITINEVIWYLVSDLMIIFNRMKEVLLPRGRIAIKQYFPFNQQYYRDKLDGIHAFKKFISLNFEVVKEIHSFYKTEGVILILLVEEKNGE